LAERHRRDGNDPVAWAMSVSPPDWLVRLRPRDGTVYVSQSRTVMATGRDGFIGDNAEQGLWVYQTRMLSRYRWLIEGKPPEMTANSNVRQHSWLGYYIASPPGMVDYGHDEQNPTQQTVELRLSRFIADGMHEDVDITNWTREAVTVQAELDIDADFADFAETLGERLQRGELKREWRQTGSGYELLFDYHVEHAYRHQEDHGVARMHRSLLVRVERYGSPPEYRDGRIVFNVHLGPHATWHACLAFDPTVEVDRMGAKYGCYEFFGSARNQWDERRGIFLHESTGFEAPLRHTLTNVVLGCLEQSKRDLASLRLYDLDSGPRAWVPAAGLPIYVALFGRDPLAASWEASLLGTDMIQGTLPALAHYQGEKIDNWRDEQPGRFPHEVHTGPLSVLNFAPHGLYYGGVTASIYYPTVVSALWHWTGDKDLVRQYVVPALRGLAWADRYADLDGDGFYEYQTFSEQGERNQGWKDSGDGIVYGDGTIVDTPLGTCEMQAFAYVSKLHFSELLWWLDMHDEARRLHHEAEELKKRFNDAFWMPAHNYIAMGLDEDKRQIDSVASDPGHCLASGIIDEALVPAVAERMMSRDLFSGWGIRTLSADHPAFNPFAYHRGTVWPVENAVFALALARYGLHDKVNTLCRALFESAALYDYYRLPELMGGHQRDEHHPFAGAYPGANWPQAWSASAAFTMLQAMLGLYPYAPLHALLLDPWLPEWLPEITLRGLRIGEAVATIRFHRQRSGITDYDVLELRGKLHVLRQPSPWSLTAGFGERVKDAVESLLPGK
jgi:glycogen debranching enzyme